MFGTTITVATSTTSTSTITTIIITIVTIVVALECPRTLHKFSFMNILRRTCQCFVSHCGPSLSTPSRCSLSRGKGFLVALRQVFSQRQHTSETQREGDPPPFLTLGRRDESFPDPVFSQPDQNSMTPRRSSCPENSRPSIFLEAIIFSPNFPAASHNSLQQSSCAAPAATRAADPRDYLGAEWLSCIRVEEKESYHYTTTFVMTCIVRESIYPTQQQPRSRKSRPHWA